MKQWSRRSWKRGSSVKCKRAHCCLTFTRPTRKTEHGSRPPAATNLRLLKNPGTPFDHQVVFEHCPTCKALPLPHDDCRMTPWKWLEPGGMLSQAAYDAPNPSPICSSDLLYRKVAWRIMPILFVGYRSEEHTSELQSLR